MTAKTQANYSREIMLAVVGLTPQVVTEALYALTQYEDDVLGRSFPCPTEIHLITSNEGAELIKRDLFDTKNGYIELFCDTYGFQVPRCDASTLHVMPSGNQATGAADTILDVVRKLTADDGARIHFSIAGGRKTMSYLLGYCASMLGRAQDLMWHVTVNHQYDPERFFPDPDTGRESSGIDLSKVPFIRLRNRLPQTLLNEKRSFSDTARYVNAIEDPKIKLSLTSPKGQASAYKWGVEVVGGPTLKLPPKQFALYWMFARARLRESGPVTSGSFKQDYLDLALPAYRLTSDEGARYEEELEAAKNMSLAKFRNLVHKLNQTLRDTLPWSDESIGVKESSNGLQPKFRIYSFGLRLPADSIELVVPEHLQHLTSKPQAPPVHSSISPGTMG